MTTSPSKKIIPNFVGKQKTSCYILKIQKLEFIESVKKWKWRNFDLFFARSPTHHLEAQKIIYSKFRTSLSDSFGDSLSKRIKFTAWATGSEAPSCRFSTKTTVLRGWWNFVALIAGKFCSSYQRLYCNSVKSHVPHMRPGLKIFLNSMKSHGNGTTPWLGSACEKGRFKQKNGGSSRPRSACHLGWMDTARPWGSSPGAVSQGALQVQNLCRTFHSTQWCDLQH